MNYKKETLIRAAFGLPIGIAIGATISLGFALAKGGDTPSMFGGDALKFYVISYIVSAVIGTIFAASSVIWDVEKWSLRKQTMLHFAITITTHLSCAVIARWIPFTLKAVLFYAGLYLVLYIIIFLIVYNIQKKRINELNKALES